MWANNSSEIVIFLVLWIPHILHLYLFKENDNNMN